MNLFPDAPSIDEEIAALHREIGQHNPSAPAQMVNQVFKGRLWDTCRALENLPEAPAEVHFPLARETASGDVVDSQSE